jgi:4,5-dihydroxyphthalate decarboxylase
MAPARPLRVKTLLGDYPNTLALKLGAVATPRLDFDFADVKLPQNAFKAVVRGKYDLAEPAIVTCLQAGR